jgi:polar amino acid transport system substrate-binding protein
MVLLGGGGLLAAGRAWPQALEPLIIAAFEYPPIYQNEADKGLSGDIAVAAFKATGLEVEFRFLPVARMVASVAGNQIPCALGGAILFEAPEVADKIVVGRILQYVSQTFLYDERRYPAGIPFADPGQLAHYNIGVLSGSGIMRFLEKWGNLKLQHTPRHESLARQLQAGRIDLWATVDLTGQMYMGKTFPDEHRHYRHTRSYHRGDVSLVCSRKLDAEAGYLARFRQGLAQIKKDGTYLQIMAKYYGGKDRINPDSLPDDMK